MKNIKIIFPKLIVFSIFIALMSNCNKKPTDGDNYAGRSPVAAFTVSPTSGDKNTTFNFDASACYDYDEPTGSLQVRWDWDGDGSYDTNYSTTKTATHQYSSYGDKKIILQVKDSSGLTDTTENTISVTVIEQIEGMVYVAGGSFQMGSNDGYSDEKPVHPVNLEGFYVDKYEVTNTKYAVYLNGALSAGEIKADSISVTKDGYELHDLNDDDCQIHYTGEYFVVENGKDNYPVIEVSWYGAKAYADHYDKRLPTEAEWEYASRGGNQSQDYIYSGSNNVGDVAWYSGNSGNTTHVVGTKQPNELGIYDMIVNVWEWCNDRYDSGYYNSSPTNNPQGPATGIYYVLRGGSWYSNANNCRVANRYSYYPTNTINAIGFRCAR